MPCWTILIIESLGAMWAMLAFAKSPGTKPGDLAGHKFTRPGGPVQWESMLVIVWPTGTYVTWPSARPEQKINCLMAYQTSWDI